MTTHTEQEILSQPEVWQQTIGPLVGIIAMWRLRSLPEARRMAGGRR